MKRFRGGLVFEAHRLVYHSTPGWRVIKKKKKNHIPEITYPEPGTRCSASTRSTRASRPTTRNTPNHVPEAIHPKSYTRNYIPEIMYPEPGTRSSAATPSTRASPPTTRGPTSRKWEPETRNPEPRHPPQVQGQGREGDVVDARVRGAVRHSKLDEFVPRTQEINLRIVRQPDLGGASKSSNLNTTFRRYKGKDGKTMWSTPFAWVVMSSLSTARILHPLTRNPLSC